MDIPPGAHGCHRGLALNMPASLHTANALALARWITFARTVALGLAQGKLGGCCFPPGDKHASLWLLARMCCSRLCCAASSGTLRLVAERSKPTLSGLAVLIGLGRRAELLLRRRKPLKPSIFSIGGLPWGLSANSADFRSIT